MNSVSIAFESVAVPIGIGLIGFFVIARRMVPESVLTVLTPLVIDIALPCLIFAGMIRDFRPEAAPGWWQLPLWWMVFTALALAFTALATLLSRTKHRSEFAMALFYHNGLFVPLAFLTGMFGESSPHHIDLFLFTIAYPAFFFNTHHLFYPRKIRAAGALPLWARILNPVLVATMIALALRLGGIGDHIPGVAVSIAKSVGAMTIPLIMIIIGGSIYIDFTAKGRFDLRESLVFVLCKNIALPACMLGTIALVRPDYNVALIMTLAAAVPPITAVPIMVERLGGNRAIANQYLMASFGACVATLPAVFWAFTLLYPGR
ncbi:MAG TPA: AEC family transporter [Spirochaetota bacterium]|nr:AEC family transporter [Spirochaetota bacterium]HOS38434.1 AEC family transporter [Spirochaetota bacterium]HPI22995.1 AEC family transporter [Spirochaetota bacterium]HPU88853.1 AEC family transporter [Spirochaetota bacterium]